jgi:phosphatidylinositol 4-kinase
MARDIRQRALQKIAALSASSSSPFDRSDLDRLCKGVPSHVKPREATNGDGSSHSGGIGRVPMVWTRHPIRQFMKYDRH